MQSVYVVTVTLDKGQRQVIGAYDKIGVAGKAACLFNRADVGSISLNPHLDELEQGDTCQAYKVEMTISDGALQDVSVTDNEKNRVRAFREAGTLYTEDDLFVAYVLATSEKNAIASAETRRKIAARYIPS